MQRLVSQAVIVVILIRLVQALLHFPICCNLYHFLLNFMGKNCIEDIKVFLVEFFVLFITCDGVDGG